MDDMVKKRKKKEKEKKEKYQRRGEMQTIGGKCIN